MNTVRCPRCRQMYEFSGLPPEFCPECTFKEEADYQLVRAYVKAKPGVTAVEASEQTGVPLSKIYRYIREERLEILSAFPLSQDRFLGE